MSAVLTMIEYMFDYRRSVNTGHFPTRINDLQQRVQRMAQVLPDIGVLARPSPSHSAC